MGQRSRRSRRRSKGWGYGRRCRKSDPRMRRKSDHRGAFRWSPPRGEANRQINSETLGEDDRARTVGLDDLTGWLQRPVCFRSELDDRVGAFLARWPEALVGVGRVEKL